MLPTFLVIGAMKSGTTSLWHYLRAHPQVFMPSTKELHFFPEEGNWGKGWDWYEARFAGAGNGTVAVGEASGSYTKFPQLRGVPARISDRLPDARLVYVIRHPLDRIRSHYQHSVARARERRPIEEAVLADPSYVDTSRYALQIEQYLEHFPRDRLLVITAEDLRHDREEAVRRVYGFIGVAPSFRPAVLDREFYRTEERRGYRRWAGALRRLPGARVLGRLAPPALRQGARRAMTDRVDVVGRRMPEELRRELEDRLREDVRRLRRYLGDDFHCWGLA